MFDTMMARGLAAVAALAAMHRGMALAQVELPAGLAPGSQYQILLVTYDGMSAYSTKIADYDSFVTQEADLSPILQSLDATWTAVASTPTVNANQASNTGNIPIYDTRGDLLEPNFPSLFTSAGFKGPPFDQYGNPYDFEVWTGSTAAGLAVPGSSLGSLPDVVCGIDTPYITPGETWLDASYGPPNTELSYYAISSPITVPEPATLTLLGWALLGVGVVYLRRRRRAQA